MTGSNQPHGAGYAPVHYGQPVQPAQQEEERKLAPEERAFVRTTMGWQRHLPWVTVAEAFDQLSLKQKQSLLLNLMSDAKGEDGHWNAIAAKKSLWHRQWTAEDKILEYFRIPGFRLNIHANGPKGGSGKSSLLLLIGSRVHEIVVGSNPCLIAATESRSNNTAGNLIGISPRDFRKVTRHTEFTNQRKAGIFQNPDDVWAALYPSASGVMVLLGDPPETEEEAKKKETQLAELKRQLPDGQQLGRIVDYPPDDYEGDQKLMIWAGSLCVLQDGAQDKVETGSIPHIASNYATAEMFVGNFNSYLSQERMGDTMLDYLKWDESYPLEPGVRPRDGRHYSIKKKIEDSVIVITNVPEGAEAKFDNFVRKGLGSARKVIHRDPYMDNETGDHVRPIDPHAITELTHLEIDELIVALCAVSAKTLGLDDSHIKTMPTVKQGYHPQKQRVDDLGRFLPRPDYALPTPSINEAGRVMWASQAQRLVESPPLQGQFELPPAPTQQPNGSPAALPQAALPPAGQGQTPPSGWPAAPPPPYDRPMQAFQPAPGQYFPAPVVISGAKNGTHFDSTVPPRHSAS